MIFLIFPFLAAAVVYAALEGAVPLNCSAVTSQEGKSTWCPCGDKCIDGTNIDTPGQCAHLDNYPEVCGELDHEPSCSSTEALRFVFQEDVDVFGHPAPGLGSCPGTSPCNNPTANIWHKHNVSWQCCSCPEGFIAGAPHCPPADAKYVPNWGQCWRCNETDEELVEEDYSFYKCMGKCIPSSTSCDFYQRLEKNHHCGSKGYAFKFGYPQCQNFLQSSSKFSPQGKLWLPKVRKCLQQRLVADCQAKSISCDQIEKDAFASHPDCYISTGFCDLPFSDWNQVRSLVGWDIIANLGAALDTVDSCSDVYDKYAQQWAKKLEKSAEDALTKLEQRVCSIVPKWC